MKYLTKILMVMALGVVICIPRAAWSDTISDSFTVYDSSGNNAYQVSVTEAVENANGPTYFYYIPVTGLADPNMYGKPTELIEPPNSTAPPGSPSDLFGVLAINENYYLGFNSDTETFSSLGGDYTIKIPETGTGLYDATMYLAPTLQTAGYTATFYSDPDVPLPGTLLLLGSGLLGLVGLRKFRKS
jgi:hypothetical protein